MRPSGPKSSLDRRRAETRLRVPSALLRNLRAIRPEHQRMFQHDRQADPREIARSAIGE